MIAERGIHLSVIAARKLPFLCRLFKSAGGDFDQVSFPTTFFTIKSLE